MAWDCNCIWTKKAVRWEIPHLWSPQWTPPDLEEGLYFGLAPELHAFFPVLASALKVQKQPVDKISGMLAQIIAPKLYTSCPYTLHYQALKTSKQTSKQQKKSFITMSLKEQLKNINLIISWLLSMHNHSLAHWSQWLPWGEALVWLSKLHAALAILLKIEDLFAKDNWWKNYGYLDLGI